MNSVNTIPSFFTGHQIRTFTQYLRHQHKWIIALLVISFSLQAWANQRAPIYGMDDPLRILDQYLVALKPQAGASASASVQSAAITQGFTLGQSYQQAFSGFTLRTEGPSASAKVASALETLASNPLVAFIEADRRVYLSQSPTSLLLQNPVTWGTRPHRSGRSPAQ